MRDKGLDKKQSAKKKVIVSQKNLPPEVLELLKEKYPKGFSDALMKIDKGNGQFFYAVSLDTDEVSYLIKVDVKIDTEMEQVERDLFGGEDDFEGGESEEANFDQAEDAEDED